MTNHTQSLSTHPSGDKRFKAIFRRGIIVWLVFIFAESLNGTVRNLLLAPSLGNFWAHQISFFTGSILVLAIALASVRWLHASRSQLLGVGLLWLLLTVAFEIALGRFILGYSWERIAADYNLPQGGLMPVGLVLLTLAPLIAAKIRGLLRSTSQNTIKPRSPSQSFAHFAMGCIW